MESFSTAEGTEKAPRHQRHQGKSWHQKHHSKHWHLILLEKAFPSSLQKVMQTALMVIPDPLLQSPSLACSSPTQTSPLQSPCCSTALNVHMNIQIPTGLPRTAHGMLLSQQTLAGSCWSLALPRHCCKASLTSLLWTGSRAANCILRARVTSAPPVKDSSFQTP